MTVASKSITSKIEAAAQTDVGLVRRNNQDSFGTDEELGLYVVCDGMGGAAGGEIASRLAVDTFLEVARQELLSLHDVNAECTRAAMLRAAAAANRAVVSRASFDTALRGMGSTLVAARVHGESAIVLNVGDSRCYYFQADGAEQLTTDHSFVAEQVSRGLMTVEQAERSLYASVITRAIGADQDVNPDLYEATLHPGSALLLCSDGLTRHVTREELGSILAETAAEPAHSVCDRMIQLAKSRGGSDNVTCLLLRANPA
jgi:serine/threonine protein phosphatase PrpC